MQQARGLRRLCAGDLPIGKLEVNGGAVSGGGGEFRCAAVYPTPEQSLRLARQNLHLFRFKNTRFDVIGGAFYFLMVVRSILSYSYYIHHHHPALICMLSLHLLHLPWDSLLLLSLASFW